MITRTTLLFLALTVPAAAALLEVGVVPDTPDTNGTVQIALTNALVVAGVQFDLLHVTGQMDVSSPVLSPAATNHLLRTAPLDEPGARRVVIYSPAGDALPETTLVDIPLALKSPLPAGGPSLAVRNVIFTDDDGVPLSSSIVYPSPIETWRQEAFHPSTEAELAATADDADPDGDGVINLFEFLCGGDPLVGDPATHPAMTEDVDPVDGHRYLAITYRVLRSRADLVDVASLETVNLRHTWVPTPEPPRATGVEDSDIFEMQARIDMTLETNGFLRLTIQRAP